MTHSLVQARSSFHALPESCGSPTVLPQSILVISEADGVRKASVCLGVRQSRTCHILETGNDSFRFKSSSAHAPSKLRENQTLDRNRSRHHLKCRHVSCSTSNGRSKIFLHQFTKTPELMPRDSMLTFLGEAPRCVSQPAVRRPKRGSKRRTRPDKPAPTEHRPVAQ
jgi:hypothetical protein